MTNKDLQERFAAWQKQVFFPKALYPIGFKSWVDKVLRFHSPVGIKMSLQDFIALRNDEKYNLWQLGAVFYMLEIRTAVEMEMDLQQYCEYMESVEKMIMEWRKMVEPKQNELNEELRKFQEDERIRKLQEAQEIIPVEA